jgi:hypothetical protein
MTCALEVKSSLRMLHQRGSMIAQTLLNKDFTTQAQLGLSLPSMRGVCTDHVLPWNWEVIPRNLCSPEMACQDESRSANGIKGAPGFGDKSDCSQIVTR